MAERGSESKLGDQEAISRKLGEEIGRRNLQVNKEEHSKKQNRVRASNATAENHTGCQNHCFTVNILGLGLEYTGPPKTVV